MKIRSSKKNLRAKFTLQTCRLDKVAELLRKTRFRQARVAATLPPSTLFQQPHHQIPIVHPHRVGEGFPIVAAMLSEMVFFLLCCIFPA